MLNPKQIRPLKGMCLVKLLAPPKETESGLVALPDTKHPKLEKAQVIRIGAWPTTKTGLALVPEFRVGAQVIIASESGTKLRDGQDLYKVVRQAHVRAVLS